LRGGDVAQWQDSCLPLYKALGSTPAAHKKKRFEEKVVDKVDTEQGEYKC
jgi:hypothetical protein